jgi:hypothetical protein
LAVVGNDAKPDTSTCQLASQCGAGSTVDLAISSYDYAIPFTCGCLGDDPAPHIFGNACRIARQRITIAAAARGSHHDDVSTAIG